ncbi:D-alanyl-D-alanine carboxypeptidase [Streptomyces sp. CB02959]|uniref:D-alanyl-D-alanine carboxypeptidase family protein n=1 Tax=Streptomyces sp. CB02959 TaxID=2020330 RepID=UPI000C278722|nr:D-alanyl-D-alanine carboxypeptidase [Streptomyces sp. CB02959]PJN34646.1 D-alanyl-D-alanine carboxypeptidase [Streptomyces sp. CB02959]
MAGESPDKSDKKSGKEQSSGETARTERDPRLAILREERGNRDGAAKGKPEESEKDSGGGVKKAADTETSDQKTSEGKISERETSEGKASEEKAEADEAKAAEESADEPVKAAEAPQEAAQGGSGGPEGAEKAKAAAGRLEADAPADAKAAPAEEKAAPAEKAAEGGSAKGSAKGSGADSGADSAGAGDSGDADESEGVDQATAVFKTVEPKKLSAGKGTGESADEAPADDATRVFAVAKTGKPKASGKGAAEGPVDQQTAVFKLGKDAGKGAGEDAGAKAADAKADGADGAKDAKDAKAKAEGVADADERDAERTSQFVALKSSDDGSAERSIGKTAPKTPVRKPGGTPDGEEPEKEKGQKEDGQKEKGPKEKGQDEGQEKAKGAASGGKGTEPGAAKGKGSDGAPEKSAAKSPEKAAGKAPGAMPPAAASKADGKSETGKAPAAAGASAAPGTSAAEADSERTRQEPLPPLDLLAKLTNTPPPPETTVRVVVRRFKIWTPLAVLLAIIFAVVQAVRPLPDPTLTLGDAKSSYTFEGGNLSIPWPEKGQAAVKVVGSGALGTFGEEKPVPTASVAKIMTAYVILKDRPLKSKDDKGPQIEVDAKTVAEGGSESESRIEGLKTGQKFSEQDMLKMLMIPSGNNIARLLARWDTNSDSEAAFVKKMNDAAKELGMKNTTYTDPSGLDARTVSTAVDQLKLAEAVMKFDAFRPIVALPNADIPGLPTRINNNNDRLIVAGLSVKGIKTGSSSAAGGTLSWAAYKTVDGKDVLILGTMMDQHFQGLDPNGSNSLTMVQNNSKKVIEAVRNALTSATAVKKGQVVGYVDDGLGGQTPVVATKDLKAIGVPGQKLALQVGDGGKVAPHEAAAGTVVGELIVGSGAEAQRVPVALQKALAKPSFGARLIRLG